MFEVYILVSKCISAATVSDLTLRKPTGNKLSGCEAYQNDKFEILGLEVR